MQNKHGFTIIELIIVIVILGVLSVTAAPFFIDVSTDARLAKLDALEGSMRSASSMVNYKARIENKTDCDTDPTVEVQGEAITFLPDGSGYITISEGLNPPINRFATEG